MRWQVWLVVGMVALAITAPSTAAAPPASAASSGPCVGAPRSPFSDIGSSRTAIDCTRWYRLMDGRTAHRFRPKARIQRAETAVLLARAVVATGRSLPRTAEPAFTDIAAHPNRRAIEGLAAAGIIRGSGRFRPAEPITRARLTVWLVRADNFATGAGLGTAPRAFPDDDGHRLEPWIDRAARRRLVPRGDRFQPDAWTTRAAAARFGRLVLRRWDRTGDLQRRAVRYESRAVPLSPAQRRTMRGVSHHAGCPVALDDLRLVHVIHHGFGGARLWGALVVHRDTVADTRTAFRGLYRRGFAIRRMLLIDRYGGDDDRSMAANNTSAYNCRRVTGGTTWSQHAYGHAIDLNPVQNPYVRGSVVEPAKGRRYLDRSDVRKGMLTRPGAVRAFDRLGWGWGGDWTSFKDYQHVSVTGR
jgi:hypothetical protein